MPGITGGKSRRVWTQGCCNQTRGFDSSLQLLCGNGMAWSRWHKETAYRLLQGVPTVADGGRN